MAWNIVLALPPVVGTNFSMTPNAGGLIITTPHNSLFAPTSAVLALLGQVPAVSGPSLRTPLAATLAVTGQVPVMGAVPVMVTGVTLVNQGGPNNSATPSDSLSNYIAIQWDPVAGATGYNVFRKNVLTGSTTQVGTNVQPLSFTASITATVLTVTGSPSGSVIPGVRFTAAGLAQETMINQRYGAASTTGAGSAGTYPVNRSQSLGSTTFTACQYIDNAATGGIVADFTAAGTPYMYYVSALNAVGEGPQSNQMVAWCYRNGESNWQNNDLSNGPLTEDYASTSGSPQGGPFDIQCIFAGGGQFQPAVFNPQCPQWTLEVGWASYLTVDINPGTTYSGGWAAQVGLVNRVPEGDLFGALAVVNAFSYGPAPQANTWGTYKVPLNGTTGLGFGTFPFAGSISGSTLTLTSVGGTNGFLDNGAFIYGPGVPAGTWVHSGGNTNTLTLWGPGNAPISASVSSTGQNWTAQKTNVYKFAVFPNASVTCYYNNLGFVYT